MNPTPPKIGLPRPARPKDPSDDVTGTASAQTSDTTSISPPAPRRNTPLPTTHPVPAAGDRVQQYRLQDLLGQGVSCYVFRAWDEANETPVAMKIVNWGNVYDRDAALKQMRAEAAALARVNHTRVVRFIDFGFDPRWPYLVLEYVDGRPLGELVRSGGTLPLGWTLYLMGQVIEGLEAVWRAGIVHRDIKPDNILVSTNGVAKLIDFGLAKSDILKLLEGAATPELAGTAAYISPEQARDAGNVDLRADVYSLGVTFYELLTGKLPFEGRNRMQMILQHLTAVPTPPREVNPEVSPLVSDLCLWMLGKKPEDRPQNGRELRQAFAKAVETATL
ncbi:serine/threonine-protein kinase [Limnoglobus roseus]|uniref:Serine/threonine protein kinase n=1 Tax=Limnoglobus roseus TaxID=2598579 RepID=A0A5C1AMR4_9BACT|nr:serine/threonine-protein kinase [Limnoglobus roseus]QEL18198.1 serine/threonine protein kinase [Limnoglobus roseus]